MAKKARQPQGYANAIEMDCAELGGDGGFADALAAEVARPYIAALSEARSLLREAAGALDFEGGNDDLAARCRAFAGDEPR